MLRAAVASKHIYETLFWSGSVYALPEPWLPLPTDADVRGCPEDLARLWTDLEARFTPAALLRSGIAWETAPGRLQLSPALQAGGPLIFVRPKPRTLPIEVLTSQGCLSGRHLPVVAALNDDRTRMALAAGEGLLLAASTLDDVIVLRALGLAATLATGLESIDRQQLDRLKDYFGWKQRPRWPPQSDSAKDGPLDCPVSPTIFPSAARAGGRPTSAPGSAQAPPQPTMECAPGPHVAPSHQPGSVPPSGRPLWSSASQAQAPGPTAPPARRTPQHAVSPPSIPTADTTQDAPPHPSAARLAALASGRGPDSAPKHAAPTDAPQPAAEQPSASSTPGAHATRHSVWLASMEEQEPAPAGPPLILVNWSPAQVALAPPPALAAVVQRLRDIHRHLDMEGMDIGLWTPEERDVERLRWRTGFDVRAAAADPLFMGIDEVCLDPLTDLPPEWLPLPRPNNFLEAQRAYRGLLRKPVLDEPSRQRLLQAQAAWEEYLEAELLQPLLRPNAPPATRNVQALVIAMSRMLHRQALATDEMLAQASPEALLRNAEIVPRARLEALSALARSFLALQRGLRP